MIKQRIPLNIEPGTDIQVADAETIAYRCLVRARRDVLNLKELQGLEVYYETETKKYIVTFYVEGGELTAHLREVTRNDD